MVKSRQQISERKSKSGFKNTGQNCILELGGISNKKSLVSGEL